jgi:hypothetical protein
MLSMDLEYIIQMQIEDAKPETSPESCKYSLQTFSAVLYILQTTQVYVTSYTMSVYASQYSGLVS